MKLTALLLTATLLAGCTTLPPASAPGLSDVLDDILPGTRGLTLADQDRIDRTVARACAAQVYSRPACAHHTTASATRRGAN